LQSNQRDHRQQCIAERMMAHDPPLPDAFGAGGADIVEIEHLQHRGSGHARDRGHRRGTQGDRRQHQVGGGAPHHRPVAGEHPVDERHPGDVTPRHAFVQQAPERQPPQDTPEHQQQEDAGPEDRHGHADQDADHRAGIEQRTWVAGREHPDRQAEDDREQQRGET
jgi:hypothetical protein